MNSILREQSRPTAATRWRALAVQPAGMLALAALLALAPAVGAQEREPDPGEDHEVRSFAIPETSLARALMEQARQHVAARRWSDAIRTLQALIEDHRGEVLGGRTSEAGGGWRSQQAVHDGASAQAVRLLAELPPEARRQYVERYSAEARAALEGARSAGDRAALAEVARRWPLTPEARAAWWSLGDLELELGHLEAARAAWQRAARACEAADEPLGEGALARLDFAFPAELESTRLGEEGAPASGALVPPGPGAQSWRVRIDGGGTGNPFNPAYFGERYNLLPVLAGDVVLVSNTLRVTAVDAWTGRVLWETPEPPGWREVDLGLARSTDGSVYEREDFFDAIDRNGLVSYPASAGHVVVAALQVPITQIENTSYQRIRITTIIPDRRLFAFDLDSGRPLWNHLPPEGWDGESGSFSERMRVAGPPVVAGSRVLVPTYRLQGRVDYHVACYDLIDGALLWSTGVISGQTPLNMFGRHGQEFVAAPLVVQDETVYALTQLGAVAALDLYTGDLLWETLYERLPLPQNRRQWDAPRRRQYWSNTPPVLREGLVLATPIDSTDLIALDATHGAMLWSVAQTSLVGPGRERWTLLGADRETVYLGGTSVLACRAPAGLVGSRPPTDVQSSPSLTSDTPARAALGERWIVAPTPARRVVLDRLNLRLESRQLSSPWEGEAESGNALLAEGALFTLTGKYLSCLFDWSVQERRFEAALEANPGDHLLALSYSAMLLDRARKAASEADLEMAQDQLTRARRELEPRLELEERGSRTKARLTLHRALRLEAEVLARRADPAAALELLERARELAPGLEELRDTLLETARLLAFRGEAARRLEVLDELESSCGSLPMPTSSGILGDDLPAGIELEIGPQLVGQWVATERIQELRRRGDAPGEMEALHTALAEVGDVPLGSAASAQHVTERIATLLGERGRSLYVPFEARARELLDESLAAGEAAGLDRVVALYPHSEAAREANTRRLELAWHQRDPAGLARLVQELLPARWIPETATNEEVDALLKLGDLLGEAGNPALETGLVQRLAAARPGAASGDEAGTPLADLAAELARATPPSPPSEGATFDTALTGHAPHRGEHELWGKVRASDGSTEILIFSRGETRRSRTLVAYRADAPREPLWELAVERAALVRSESRAHAVLPGVIVLGRSGDLAAVEPQRGLPLWSREIGLESLEGLFGASGVVVATLSTREREDRLVALDAAGGVELWSRPIGRGLHAVPIVGTEHVVLLPRTSNTRQAEVLDLFTGRLAHELELREDVGEADLRGAWIEEGVLVLPSFPRPGAAPSDSGHCVQGLDLRSGRPAWGIAREQARELDSIVRCGRDAYLVLYPTPFSGGGSGALVQLDTRLGAVRPVTGVRFTIEDAPLGVRRSSVVELDEPYLYLLSPLPGGRESLIRALHLPYGERWAHRLPVPSDDLLDTPPPLPAQSQTLVALAFSEADAAVSPRARPRTTLLLLDRASGLPRDARAVPDDLGRADGLHLSASGDALFLHSREALMILAKE